MVLGLALLAVVCRQIFYAAVTCWADCFALQVSEQSFGGQINNLIFSFVHLQTDANEGRPRGEERQGTTQMKQSLYHGCGSAVPVHVGEMTVHFEKIGVE